MEENIFISVEFYIEDGEKMLYIAEENSSGAEYPAETAEDAGDAIAFYIKNYTTFFDDIKREV